MGLSKSDAIVIFNEYFREPQYSECARKYSFHTLGVSTESLAKIHRELYEQGSDVTKKELLDFINQEWEENPVPFLHLPLDYIIPGEVFEIQQTDCNNKRSEAICVKLDDSHFLVGAYKVQSSKPHSSEIITCDKSHVIGELMPSPFEEGATILAVKLISPPIFYRYLDSFLLNEDYIDSKPTSILPLYSLLAKSHYDRTVTKEWANILEVASKVGASTFTIFKLLDYLAKR